jgi:hypothetical protein
MVNENTFFVLASLLPFFIHKLHGLLFFVVAAATLFNNSSFPFPFSITCSGGSLSTSSDGDIGNGISCAPSIKAVCASLPRGFIPSPSAAGIVLLLLPLPGFDVTRCKKASSSSVRTGLELHGLAFDATFVIYWRAIFWYHIIATRIKVY